MSQPPETSDGGVESQPPADPAAPRPPEDPQLAQALAAASQQQSRGPSRLTLGLAAALLLVGGFGAGYLVGNQHGDEHQASQRVGFPDGFAQNGPGGSQPGGGQPPSVGDFTAGTVTKVDGDTVTVKTADGDEVTVKTDDDTDVTITKDGSLSDLSPGDPVVVNGSRQSDGSISADSISEGNKRLALTPGAGT
jgi:hypothetical protein